MAVVTKRNLSFGWVEAAIRYGGVFGAAEKIVYREIFGLSEPTVSRHQAEFEALFEQACGPVFLRDEEGRVQGGRLTLDESATLPEAPVFSSIPRLERWLDDMLGSRGYVEADLRQPDPNLAVVRTVVRAIRTETPLLVTVDGGGREQGRLVSPHAIFRIKGRFLMRGYEHLTMQYRDTALARITRVVLAPGTEPYRDARLDEAWKRFSTVVTRSSDAGPDDEVYAFSDKEDEDEGYGEIQVREAFLPYLRDEIVGSYLDTDPVSKGDPGRKSKPGRS
ncbi:hypothetical protein LZ686_16525 [Paracoccus sp. NFXS7]